MKQSQTKMIALAGGIVLIVILLMRRKQQPASPDFTGLASLEIAQRLRELTMALFPPPPAEPPPAPFPNVATNASPPPAPAIIAIEKMRSTRSIPGSSGPASVIGSKSSGISSAGLSKGGRPNYRLGATMRPGR